MKVEYQKEVAPSIYRFHPAHLKWAGLHISTGAMLIYMIAIRLPDGKTPTNPFVVAIMGLVVFAVNGMLQLLPHSNPGKSLSAQYSFVKKYRPVFVKAIAGSLFLAAILCWFIPSLYWNIGIGVCGVTALGLWLCTKLPPTSGSHVYKEPVTALLYTTGIWGSVWLSAEIGLRDSALMGITFLLSTFQLLLILSHFNALDRTGAPNMARWMGKARTSNVIYGCTVVMMLLGVGVCLGSEFRYTQRISVLFMTLSLLHALIFFKSGRTTYRQNWWALAEFSGLFPLLLL